MPPETKLLKHDFVLVTDEEQHKIRGWEAGKEAERQRGNLMVVNGVLIPSHGWGSGTHIDERLWYFPIATYRFLAPER